MTQIRDDFRLLKMAKQIAKELQTQPHDLVTVCANCHRMLHRMDGKAGDIAKLGP